MEKATEIIRTEADVRALDQKIQRELGVDIGKYRDEETIATLSDLLVFPVYAIQWIARGVLFALLAYLIGFLLIDLVHVQYLIYGIIGFALFLITGLLAGILYLTVRFRADIQRLMRYSMDILKGIVEDVDKLNTTTNKDNRRENLQLLFLGVTHMITIPATATILSNKVPFVGGLLSGFVRKILTRLSNLFRFDKIEMRDAAQQAGGEGKIMPMYVASVTRFHDFTDKAVGIAIKVVQWPVGLFFVVMALVTWLFVNLIN